MNKPVFLVVFIILVNVLYCENTNRFLLVSMHESGHVNPMKSIAAELLERGNNQVTFCSTELGVKRMKDANIENLKYTSFGEYVLTEKEDKIFKRKVFQKGRPFSEVIGKKNHHYVFGLKIS
eukprot:TRINITY_DN2505_c0_g1_i1.p1 TRINITY_DN2505_c0_g1~~TRINITY_DN2505_c0_g1_i1.p1  ORF type:complete len:122 (-),score=17.34 TRINITY_DN2505_c0_g1_i1:37-402(-)